MYWLGKFRLVFVTAAENAIDRSDYTLYSQPGTELYKIKNSIVVARSNRQELDWSRLYTRWPVKCMIFTRSHRYYLCHKPISEDMLLSHYIQTGAYTVTLYRLNYYIEYKYAPGTLTKITLTRSNNSAMVAKDIFENLWFMPSCNMTYLVKFD